MYNSGYTRVDVGGTWRILERIGWLQKLELTARIQNLLNEGYAEVRGFPALGINALVGLRAVVLGERRDDRRGVRRGRERGGGGREPAAAPRPVLGGAPRRLRSDARAIVNLHVGKNDPVRGSGRR